MRPAAIRANSGIDHRDMLASFARVERSCVKRFGVPVYGTKGKHRSRPRAKI
jgi:hypothetical protein